MLELHPTDTSLNTLTLEVQDQLTLRIYEEENKVVMRHTVDGVEQKDVTNRKIFN
jgi:hypothetical protein